MDTPESLAQSVIANSAVNALISNRLYPNAAPKGFRYPAVVYHAYHTEQAYDMAGPINTADVYIQFDIYGSSFSSTSAVSVALQSFLNAFTGTLSNNDVVTACFLENALDMPYVPDSQPSGISFHSILQYRVVRKRS